MKVSLTPLPGVALIEPAVHGDDRGFLFELYEQRRYAAAGIGATFVQDNVSLSSRGILRGLHFQNPKAQAKLVTVLAGEIYDVAVDVRIGSPTFGQWTTAVLSAANRLQFYVADGFAHGFYVTSDQALVIYKCSDVYAPSAALTLAWDDPDLGIPWPGRNPTLSGGDRRGSRLSDLLKDGKLPAWDPRP